MFISVRRCAEPMTQLRRLKVRVTVTGNGIWHPYLLQLRVCSISHQTLEGLSLHFDKMFSSVRGCAKHIAQSCKLKAKVTVEGNEIEH